MLKGSLVAIVTPMHDDGSLDLDRLRALVDFHLAEGTDGIVVVGTTGESPTVNFDEHCLLIRTVVDQVAGRIPVIAGTGANSTSEAIELTTCAKAAGADYSLLVTPYYNKPTQEGLYRHFKAIAEAVDIPQILYNVPGRTACDMLNDTVLRLAQIPNIVGIKDATGNIERGSDLLLRAPQDFAVYSGDDGSCLALMSSLLGQQARRTDRRRSAPVERHQHHRRRCGGCRRAGCRWRGGAHRRSRRPRRPRGRSSPGGRATALSQPRGRWGRTWSAKSSMERMTLSWGMSPTWNCTISVPAPQAAMLRWIRSSPCSGVPISGSPADSTGPPGGLELAGDLDSGPVRALPVYPGGKNMGRGRVKHRSRKYRMWGSISPRSPSPPLRGGRRRSS